MPDDGAAMAAGTAADKRSCWIVPTNYEAFGHSLENKTGRLPLRTQRQHRAHGSFNYAHWVRRHASLTKAAMSKQTMDDDQCRGFGMIEPIPMRQVFRHVNIVSLHLRNTGEGPLNLKATGK